MGQKTPLTTGTDTFTGVSGNDVFNASTGLSADGTTAIATTNALDKIDGGAGTDTLNIENTGGKNTLTGTITNVENLTFIGAGEVNNSVAANVSSFSGTVTLSQTDDVAVSVSNVSGQTLALNKVAAGTTLTAALTATQTSVTLSNTAAAGAASFSVAGTKLDTVNLTTDKTADALTVADTGNTTKTANITATGTAAVTVNSTALETVKISGAGAVTLTAGTAPSKALDASGSTGGVTYAVDLVAQQFTGSSAKDTVQFGATTKAQTLGAGDDAVTMSVAALGTGGSIDGGDGTDTITLAAANAATATADATAKAAFADKISGFERLTLGATTASAEVKLNNLDNINYVNVGDVATGQTLTLSGAASGFTLNANSGTTVTGAVAVALATDGAVGVVDVLNVGISNSTAQDLQALTANKFETINFASDDTATTPAGGFLHIVSALSADAVKTINVTGDAGFNLGYTGTTATTVDASGITNGGFTWSAGALAASSVVKGSATGTNTINLDSTTTASTFVTYTGGSGNDVVDASSSNNNNVFSLLGGDNNLASGNGNNTVTLASDKAVAVANGATGNAIVLGNGTNTVTDTGTKGAYVEVGTGSNTITLGSGNDFVKVGAAAGLNVINVGSGTDTVVIGGVQTAGGYYTSITGFGVGDKLDLAAVTATAATDAALGAKITLGANASFANYLDAAAAGTIADSAAAVIKWFQFSGNTYVVVDTETGAGVDGNTFQDGVDSVVELVGLIDLSTSATVSDVLTLA